MKTAAWFVAGVALGRGVAYATTGAALPQFGPRALLSGPVTVASGVGLAAVGWLGRREPFGRGAMLAGATLAVWGLWEQRQGATSIAEGVVKGAGRIVEDVGGFFSQKFAEAKIGLFRLAGQDRRNAAAWLPPANTHPFTLRSGGRAQSLQQVLRYDHGYGQELVWAPTGSFGGLVP